MKAAVWYGDEQISLEELETPKPGEHEVRIAVKWCGVCGTDVHILRGEFPLWTPPAILGHEYSGVVAEIGSQVSTVSVGDRVTVDPSGAVCGQCGFCRAGQPHFCVQRKILRGAFAEYTSVPEKVVYKIPDEMSFKKAALIEPLSCVLHAIDLAGILPGETILVLGGGPIGLLLTNVLKYSGASLVILSEPLESRRMLAQSMGADITIDPTKGTLESVVQDVTDGLGPHIVFDAVGLPQTFTASLELVRRGGKCVMVGMSPPNSQVLIRPYTLFWKELTILGSHMRLFNYQRTIDLLPRLQVGNLLTNFYTLETLLETIKAVENNRVLKPLVQPV